VIYRPQPYFEFLIYYPPASHIIGAFVQRIAGYPIEKIVVSLSAIFTSLTVLSMYSLVKSIFKNKITAIFASSLIILFPYFWHPLTFTFVSPLTVFSICSGMALMIKSFWSEMAGWAKAIFLSLIFSFSIYVHPSSTVYLATLLLALVVARAWRIRKKTITIAGIKNSVLGSLLMMVLVLVFSSYYLMVIYRFLSNSTSGLPADWVFPYQRETWMSISSNPYYRPRETLLNIFYLSRFAADQGVLLYLGPPSVMFALGYLFLRSKAKEGFSIEGDTTQIKWAFLSRITLVFFIQFEFLLIFLKYIDQIQLPFSFANLPSNTLYYIVGGPSTPLRIWESLYVSLIVLLCAMLAFTALLPSMFRQLSRTITVRFHLLKMHASVRFRRLNFKGAVILLLSILILLPAIFYYPDGVDRYISKPFEPYQNSFDTVRQYSLLREADLAMFEWIKTQTPEDAVFLVSSIDTGQYLTSATGRKSIYPPGPLTDSRDYRILTFGIETEPDNPYIASFLQAYNITYVFIGSNKYDPNAPTWDVPFKQNAFFVPERLSTSPLFALQKNIGDSYVFKVVCQDSVDLIGPTVVGSINSSVLDETNIKDRWVARNGSFDDNVDSNMWILSIGYESDLWALFELGQQRNFASFTSMYFWAESTYHRTYRLTMYDENNNYRYWSFDAKNSSTFVLLDLNSFDGESNPDFSVESLARLEIDFRSINPSLDLVKTRFRISPIWVSPGLVETSLIEHFNLENNSSRFVLQIDRFTEAVFKIPLFLSLTSVNPTNDNVLILPDNVLYVPRNTLHNIQISFQISSHDSRNLLSEFLPRSLRYANFSRYTPFSNASLSSSSTVNLFGASTQRVNMKKPWDMVILEFSQVDIQKGRLCIGLYQDTSMGATTATIKLYKSYDDFLNNRNLVATFSSSDVARWVLFEEELIDVHNLYFVIENFDMKGEFYLWMRLYSYGVYY